MENTTEKKVKRINLLQLSMRKELDNDDYASLTWNVRDGYPRIQVFTTKNFKKEDGTNDYDKLIIAPFTYPVLYTLITAIERAAGVMTFQVDDVPVTRIECYNTKFIDGKRTNDVVKQAEVIIAKSQAGVIELGVKNDKASVYFPLLPNTKWHKFYTTEGTPILDNRVLSKIQTAAYARLLRETFANVLLNEEIETEK